MYRLSEADVLDEPRIVCRDALEGEGKETRSNTWVLGSEFGVLGSE